MGTQDLTYEFSQSEGIRQDKYVLETFEAIVSNLDEKPYKEYNLEFHVNIFLII